jgi:hypothetical protein
MGVPIQSGRPPSSSAVYSLDPILFPSLYKFIDDIQTGQGHEHPAKKIYYDLWNQHMKILTIRHRNKYEQTCTARDTN